MFNRNFDTGSFLPTVVSSEKVNEIKTIAVDLGSAACDLWWENWWVSFDD